MTALLLAFLQQQNSTDGTFNYSYTVSGSGCGDEADGTYTHGGEYGGQWYYTRLSGGNGAARYIWITYSDGVYTFTIASQLGGGGALYYQWTGTCPQDINNPTCLDPEVAPFPTIQ